jgi:hypothetical protein
MARTKKPAVHTLEIAPLSATVRAKLRHDLQNLKATAARKNTTLDRYDEASESAAGSANFELGCWLYYYSTRVGQPDSFQDRVDCARRIFLAGYTYLHYEFFTAFDFGERQFDTIFEMGDGSEVVEALRGMLPGDRTGNLARAFAYANWPLEA